MAPQTGRTHTDRCPGVLRPWPADDGLLVRLRLVGGRLPASVLMALVSIAERYGDARVHLTSRANLQLRALPADERGHVPDEVVAAIEVTGLLPSRSHELARNIMVSPQSGLPGAVGGAADLRPVAIELDRLLCATPVLAGLPGRFLFVLDDGRGDLLDRSCDLGLVALSAEEAQLRIGDGWGPVVPLTLAAGALVGLAVEFMAHRGSGPAAAWHVRELGKPLGDGTVTRPVRSQQSAEVSALPFGKVAGGLHVGVPDGVESTLAAELATRADELIVTPWRGVLVPTQESR